MNRKAAKAAKKREGRRVSFGLSVGRKMKRNAETGRKRGKAEMGKLKADFRTEGVPTSVGLACVGSKD